MISVKAAKRYAKGLLDFARESGNAEQINREMIDVKNSIKKSRDLAQFLNSPILDSRRKTQISRELFKGFSPSTNNFIELVIRHRREGGLAQIAQFYNDMYDEANHIKTAKVTSAIELNEGLIQDILNKAKAGIGENYTYKIENKVDSDLIGGFVLTVGDKQIDTSIKSKISRLKKEFNINHYIPKI